MSLPEDELHCPVCLQVARDAVEAVCCHKFFCAECAGRVPRCPTCRADPFRTSPSVAVRRLVDRLRDRCDICGVNVLHSDFAAHRTRCDIPKKCSAHNCLFIAPNCFVAFQHLMSNHLELIWKNFANLFPHGIQ